MRRLKFIYKRRLEFENAVTNHYFSIKCVPVQNEMQKLEHFAFEMNPQVQYFEAKDAFLNDVYHGCICESHHYFEFKASGAVIVKNGPYKDERLTALLKYPSPYTEVEGQLKVFTDELVLPTAYSALDQAYFLMNKVYEEMNYVSQITNIHTTASQAFALRKGVCQDYAHILLALCRKIGIPAKYVAGFMIGEGKTHAWVEVYSGGMWYGLDPTHNTYVDDTYVKLAVGRDYGDCNIDKGLFRGYTKQEQEIMVKVEE